MFTKHGTMIAFHVFATSWLTFYRLIIKGY
jgi:hypothetical protein